MKFCPNCGKQLWDEDNFCIFCGYSFVGRGSQQTAPVPAKQPQRVPEPPRVHPEPGSGGLGIILLIAGALLFVVIIGAAFIPLIGSPSDGSSNTLTGRPNNVEGIQVTGNRTAGYLASFVIIDSGGVPIGADGQVNFIMYQGTQILCNESFAVQAGQFHSINFSNDVLLGSYVTRGPVLAYQWQIPSDSIAVPKLGPSNTVTVQVTFTTPAGFTYTTEYYMDGTIFAA